MPGDVSPAFFFKFIWGQLFGKIPRPTASFAGKTVIITGANVGLGFEAARQIIKLGAAKIIIAVRTVEKGEAAKRSLEQSTGCDPKIIEVWPLDLCSYASVKDFAARATRDLQRIDVFLENAGVALSKWQTAEDNEQTITVNVVSTFLLAFLLLPKLKETAAQFNTRPTLTVVTSDTHFTVDFKEKDAPEGIFNSLNEESKANMDDRYPISKLLEVYIVREIAARRPADSYPVTVNMVNPGLCESELSRDAGMDIKIMKFLFARTTEVGSRTLVDGASRGADTHGQYLSMCRVTQPATLVVGPDGPKTQKRVWDELISKLEKIEPGIAGNL